VTVESLKSAHFNDAARIIDTAAPYTTAKLFLDQFVAPDKTRTIHHHRGAFYRWKENAYPEIADTELRSELYDFLDRSFVIKNGKTVRVKPNQAMVTNVLDGLRGASHLSGSISAPAWLSHGDVPAEEIVACANGLLHLPTLNLFPGTPAFFTYNALDFITGEDAITVDRKYLPAWTGQLQTRFVIISNELPRLADASGALSSRFIVLLLENSFYGREDQTLAARLLKELPGILNWAITGWHRLISFGHFTQPKSALEAVQQLEELGSPTGAFIREKCEIGAGHTATIDQLFGAWCQWCQEQGRDKPGTKQTFGRDLRAACPA
jgi:hypothetical protein